MEEYNVLEYFKDALLACARRELPFNECACILADICAADVSHSLPWCALIPLLNAELHILGKGNVTQLGSLEVTPAEEDEILDKLVNTTISYLSISEDSNRFPVDKSLLPRATCTTESTDLAISNECTPRQNPIRHLDGLRRLPWVPNESSNGLHGTKPFKRSNIDGQLKLFLMEVEFLSEQSWSPGDVVVYAGAAPGQHIPLLAAVMFPELNFLLYDPAPFAFDIESSGLSNVTIMNKMFTDEEAKLLAERYCTLGDTSDSRGVDRVQSMADNVIPRLRNTNLLFISDIRRVQESEQLVADDMHLQSRWCHILDPVAAMLKFRLGFGLGQTVYLSGDVRLQPYTSERSTEARLIVRKSEATQEKSFVSVPAKSSGAEDCHSMDKSKYSLCVYDNLIYEERFYHFNTIERLLAHAHVSEVGIHPTLVPSLTSSRLMISGPLSDAGDIPSYASSRVDNLLRAHNALNYEDAFVSALPMTWDAAVEVSILKKYLRFRLGGGDLHSCKQDPNINLLPDGLLANCLRIWLQLSKGTDSQSEILPSAGDCATQPLTIDLAGTGHRCDTSSLIVDYCSASAKTHGLIIASLALWVRDYLQTSSVAARIVRRETARKSYLRQVMTESSRSKNKRRRKR